MLKVTGVLELRLTREDGGVEVTTIENLVVNVGKAVFADRMKAAPAHAAMTHIAVGTGGTAQTVGDAALVSETAGSRIAISTAVAAAVITYVGSYGAGLVLSAIVEAGIFNAASGGDMLSRTTFPVVNKDLNDILQITWTVTVG